MEDRGSVGVALPMTALPVRHVAGLESVPEDEVCAFVADPVVVGVFLVGVIDRRAVVEGIDHAVEVRVQPALIGDLVEVGVELGPGGYVGGVSDPVVVAVPVPDAKIVDILLAVHGR